MPSLISNIFGGYDQSISLSRSRFEKMRSKRQANAQKFYDDFCHNLIREYSNFDEESKIRTMKTEIQRFFNSDKITFAAVDGTNYKQKMEDFMIFFGGAYAVKGEIDFQENPPRSRYKKWSSKEDVSMVAYVPIPYADLNDVSEGQFIMIPDKERFDLLSIDTKLMQLAEIFLLYTIIDNPNYHPDFVIWDQSMSGVMASNELPPENINMVGNFVMGTKINYQDVVISFSHPNHEDLDIPKMRIVEPYNYILRRLMNDREINLNELEIEHGIKKEITKNKIKKYLLDSPNNEGPIAKLEGDILKVEQKWINSWNTSISFFKNFCQRLFNEKDSSVLIYERFDEAGNRREQWISPTDLIYLISIGIRAVTELAWKNKTMLVGIVKDSASTYFSQKYLGTMRYIGAPDYNFEDILLPWSDRLFLQALPPTNESFKSPWSTIEFDSVFMTLHAQKNPENGQPEIAGVKGNIINNERLFFRSLAQFFLKRTEKKLNMGHVIFVDRLIFPQIEKNLSDIEVKAPLIGSVKPFFFKDKNSENRAQEVMMYVLKTLTRNLYPEVIGYPDPLHKADWGAKSMNRKVSAMIKSSGKFLKISPLARTLRQDRGSRR